MPGAEWFSGASLNFLDEIFRHSDTCPDRIAISSISETFGKETLTWSELKKRTASLSAELRRLGIKR